MTRLLQALFLGVVVLAIASSFAAVALKDTDAQKAAIKVRSIKKCPLMPSMRILDSFNATSRLSLALTFHFTWY